MQKLETLFRNPVVYDIESFSNLFTIILRELGTKTYHKYIIHESIHQGKELVAFLKEHKPTMIGYNNIGYDVQIIEHLIRNPEITAEEIYEFSQSTIEDKKDPWDVPYSEWKLTYKQVDLYKLNHFDNKSRRTSLKWLEFTLRHPKMADLPFHHTESISKSRIPQVITYNRNDVDITHEFFYECEQAVRLRLELGNKYKQWRIMNMSDSSLGEYIFKHMLSKKVDPKLLKKGGTKRDIIKIKDCLLNHITFTDPGFKKMVEEYKSSEIVVADGLKGAIDQTAEFDDMEFKFGTGGIHAAYKAGVYEADDEHEILSIDGTSYYPWVIIANKFFPEHIGATYCDVYRTVYEMRTTFAKGTAMNYALKIVLNGVYGKSNSDYSFLYDPKLTLQITINGQLMLAMLAERLSKYGRLLLVNTDGVEIMVKKKYLKEVREECEMWEALTGISLEENKYKKVVIRDVNSYIAVDLEGKGKRKGYFSQYKDLTGEDGSAHEYHKNPSANIIAMALYEYFINGVNVDEFVTNHNNIHDFLYAIKSQKNFDFWLITADELGVINIDKRNDRVIRYYISNRGANIFKHWKDGRKADITGVNRGQLVSLAMNIKDPEIEGEIKSGKYKGNPLVSYENLNRDHYIQEIYSTIDEIQNL
jgi:hypothetical protein